MDARSTLGRQWLALAAMVVLVAVSTVFVTPAAAAHVGCGSVITQSTVLDSDIGPCTVGLTIAGNGIQLDMNGHRLTGPANRTGGPGIRFNGTNRAVVRNGTVSGFTAGVAVEGGANNSVVAMNVLDNVGQGDYADGILVFESDGVRIIGNQVSRNGVFSGITLADSSNGLIDSNNISYNNIPTATGLFTDIGVWILNLRDVPASQGQPDVVGRQASFNLVVNNQVTGNGLEGIQISRFAHHNTARNNHAIANGTRQRPGVREGDGIAIFSNDNLIEFNRAYNNGGNGIGIQLTQTATTTQGVRNQILGNQTGGNGFGPNAPPNFDLFDAWPNCDNNVWRGNRFQTFNQACVTAP
ncbi:MAG: right-handed parallel beta-helix repeat-containing protein [Actinomycetota bacterium]|nr:right-handed parallel beta-helix repeat-containing protein [Actinomycetota bacterium]